MELIKFIKLIPEGVKNIDKVFEGVVNNVKLKHGDLPEDQQEEIVRRRLICSSCPYNTSNMDDQTVKNKCSMCGCGVNIKTSCLTCVCGISSYNAKNPDNQLPLKWTEYEASEHKE